MVTVVFVHGTGVRRKSFDATFELVTAGIVAVDSSVGVVPCYWGEPFGARLSRGGVSIPDGKVARGAEDNGPAEDDVQLWALLELDPLVELRLIAGASTGAEEAAPNIVPPGRLVRDAAARLPSDPEVAAAARRAGLGETFGGAVDVVLGAPVTGDALMVGGQAELAEAMARALVSEALTAADEQVSGTVPLAGPPRDALVELLVGKLHGDTRGRVGKALLAGAVVAAELGATRPVERRRIALTSAASPVSGDIMVYLARGAAIRQHIADTVAAVADDVVLLAHSLGGIACVDLLATDPPPNVQALVTVGSQAPFLHEIGALPTLEPGGSLPATFPVPWMNVYDRRDLLAFLAEPIFGERVRDVELDSRAPFPRSHSAYFGNPGLYAVVGHTVAAVNG